MAAQLIELFNSRTELLGEKPSAEFLYLAAGCADEAAVRTLALAGAPAGYNGLIRRSIEIAERLTNDSWKVTVRYDAPQTEEVETPQPVVQFDSSGGTQHITQSISTINRYGTAASTLLGGAIGYDGENVAGVDITVPVWNWQETHYLLNTAVNQPAYYYLTGKVNADGFRGYAAGEVLFLGAQGQRRGTSRWEVTFKFAASPNRSGIGVGTISGISKRGWDYMWVQYGEDIDPTVKVRIKKPVAVYVEQVYEFANFSSLGI